MNQKIIKFYYQIKYIFLFIQLLVMPVLLCIYSFIFICIHYKVYYNYNVYIMCTHIHIIMCIFIYLFIQVNVFIVLKKYDEKTMINSLETFKKQFRKARNIFCIHYETIYFIMNIRHSSFIIFLGQLLTLRDFFFQLHLPQFTSSAIALQGN